MSDLIYRDELKRTIKALVSGEVQQLLRIIDGQPKVDAKIERHGHWIVHERAEEVFGLIIPNFECSECHAWVRPDGRGRWCLECGAEMDKKVEY